MRYSLNISGLGCPRFRIAQCGFEHTYETDATGYKHVQAEAFGCHDKRRAGHSSQAGRSLWSRSSAQTAGKAAIAMPWLLPLHRNVGCHVAPWLQRSPHRLAILQLKLPRPTHKVRSKALLMGCSDQHKISSSVQLTSSPTNNCSHNQHQGTALSHRYEAG